MKVTDEGPRISAMLRHLGRGDDLRNFPGTATEKIAIVRTAGARGLITWSRARARYELTHFGWNELLPRRRFGVASLMVSAATGGIAGVVAAVIWLPVDAPRPRGYSSASISRLEKPSMLQAARSAEICVPRYAPLPAITVVWDPVEVAKPEVNEPPQLDRPDAADRSALDQPKAEPGARGAKQAGAKKSRKTAYYRRRNHSRSWAYSDPWRARNIRYAGYGGQRGWFGYR